MTCSFKMLNMKSVENRWFFGCSPINADRKNILCNDEATNKGLWSFFV